MDPQRPQDPPRATATVRKRKIKLTEEQIQALERFDSEFRERDIEVHATGELVAVDTFFAGTLKGWSPVPPSSRGGT